ncbi:MAG: hypothetical protein RI907_2920 [Pseudomonadota bacterium]
MATLASSARPLTVCVDDFGQHDGVNAAVFDLVQRGRVTAVSCLVDGVAWASGAPRLREVAGQGAQRLADVGLHLNLSETLQAAEVTGSAWAARPVSALILATYRRALSVAALQAEIERQWQAFEAHWGQPPDFVDGHQHVHQLPQVREALWAVLEARRGSLPAGFWLRDCGASVWHQVAAGVPLADALKAGVIAALGSRALRRRAAQAGWAVSAGLLGSYPFNTDAPGYLRLWRAWAALVPAQRGLLMCHPAAAQAGAAAVADPIGPARGVEFDVLKGEALATQLQAAGVRISRMAAVP